MLTEIRSEQFRVKRIAFHEGLNVVLGDENATNSIGKSTLLMIIDFAFGGENLLKHHQDLTQELGNHDYFFTFKFDGDNYIFRRGTAEPDVVHLCGDDYEIQEPLSITSYTGFLKKSYGILIEDISFRGMIGLYFRIWGKDNLSVHQPLHAVQSQSNRECVNNLIKTFDQYSSLKQLSKTLELKDAELKALRAAFRNSIIPKIGRKEHAENSKRIKEIELEINDIKGNLAKYATNIAEVMNRETLELKLEKDKHLETKLKLESQLLRIQRNISNNRHIKSKHFSDVTSFFPTINTKRLAEIEEFHSGVAKLLGSELREAADALKSEIKFVSERVSEIDEKMRETLKRVDEPTLVVDRIYALATSLQSTQTENNYYESEATLLQDSKSLHAQLSNEKTQVLGLIEKAINDELRRVISSVFGENRKSPSIKLSESTYSYDVFEDTGTGTAYANLIAFDLTIFQQTRIPAIAHDSLLFKNIENDSVANLLKIYQRTKKQSFIALDEIQKYGPDSSDLLRKKSVIQLDNQNVLYIKDWRKPSGTK